MIHTSPLRPFIIKGCHILMVLLSFHVCHNKSRAINSLIITAITLASRILTACVPKPFEEYLEVVTSKTRFAC